MKLIELRLHFGAFTGNWPTGLYNRTNEGTIISYISLSFSFSPSFDFSWSLCMFFSFSIFFFGLEYQIPSVQFNLVAHAKTFILSILNRDLMLIRNYLPPKRKKKTKNDFILWSKIPTMKIEFNILVNGNERLFSKGKNKKSRRILKLLQCVRQGQNGKDSEVLQFWLASYHNFVYLYSSSVFSSL